MTATNDRRAVFLALLLLPAVALAELPAPGAPGAPDDIRYCGEPARYADGTIKRSKAVLREFVATFPCPSSLMSTTACTGWAIDHVIPLASGGCDAKHNLQWLPDTIKSCAGTQCKDRWERKYHAFPRQEVQ
jgi:hypothetical protein